MLSSDDAEATGRASASAAAGNPRSPSFTAEAAEAAAELGFLALAVGGELLRCQEGLQGRVGLVAELAHLVEHHAPVAVAVAQGVEQLLALVVLRDQGGAHVVDLALAEAERLRELDQAFLDALGLQLLAPLRTLGFLLGADLRQGAVDAGDERGRDLVAPAAERGGDGRDVLG